MLTFKIEIFGINRFRDKLDSAIIQLTAQKLYYAIKDKVPEIEMEKSNIIFKSIGKDLILNATNLSSKLQHQLQDSGLSFS